ncbi:hypothetical protein DPMN_071910 [Dreissena polymorpha]|uniref:Uncharacterized protein n=1 Tax=Dreissena polymorpha TaxID=45954 RepID=A0A9D3Z7U5_DREPO|nr:hypothetical protein DPMN_071910 [Dreissena polymorpha]
MHHHQYEAIQHHREATTPLWSRELENHCHHHKEKTGFINCLRKILKIRWPDKISNEEL